MSASAGYSQTELGLLPRDWRVVSLSELGQPKIGLTYKPSDVQEHGTLVLRSSNVKNGRLCFEDNVFVDPKIATSALVEQGDILVCVRNGSRALIGKCAQIDRQADGMAFGAFMSVFRTPFADFVFRQFQSDGMKRQIEQHLGATINQITNASLKSFKIPFSDSVEERGAIVSTLRDIDDLIASLDALIAKKRDIKQAAMQQLLTGKTRLPGFDGAWLQTPLGALGKWRGGATPSMRRREFWDGGHIPWASSADVRTGPIQTTANAITDRAVRESSTTLLPAGAIAMVTRSGILRRFLPVGLTTRPTAINQDIKAVFPSPQFISDFVFHAVVAASDDILSSCMKSGTTVESIELPWLKRFEIAIPNDPEEQATIAGMLTEMDQEIDALITKQAKIVELKEGMMQQLLTGRIRLE